mgnify:CR=1 FL=1|jgi:hypothetical protein
MTDNTPAVPMDTIEAAQITCTVYHPMTRRALAAMQALGVRSYHMEPGRAVVLKRRTAILGLGAGITLEEEPADRILFHVMRADAEPAIQAIVAACELNIPGRGSVVSEDVDITRPSVWEPYPLTPVPGTTHIETEVDLANVICTVQRGRGDNIVKAVLGLGVPMPVVTTGEGTGLREKLGLIRIALPAGKDVVHAVVSEHEATDILGALVDSGRLDQLGSGFIFESPLARGVINSMVIRGQRHSASIEQIIAAVDDLVGSSHWRKRTVGDDDPARKHRYLRDLMSLTVICNEGHALELVHAATQAGAGGATISRLSHAGREAEGIVVSPAREITELIVDRAVAPYVARALSDGGVYDAQVAGFIVCKPVTVACTHRSANR